MDKEEFKEMLKEALQENLKIVVVGSPHHKQELVVTFDGDFICKEE